MLCNVIPVHSYLNSNHTTYLAPTVPPIVYVLENFHRKFANLVAPPIDGTTKHLVLCKCISSDRRCKQRPNRSIIGDATLPQSATKLTKCAVRNLTVCCGAIWRRREKSQYGTTSFMCTTASRIFSKIYFLYHFRGAQTCSFRAIFGLRVRTLSLAVSAIYSDLRKKIYRPPI